MKLPADQFLHVEVSNREIPCLLIYLSYSVRYLSVYVSWRRETVCCQGQSSHEITPNKSFVVCWRHNVFILCYSNFCENTQGYPPGIRSCLWSEINNNKSSITFSSKTPITIKDSMKQILDIQKEGGPGKYLGLPEHFGRRKNDLFTSVVDRIKQRAASWSTCHISKAWKMTRVKSVITAVPTYYMSCFLIHVDLCKHIQSALTRFWWDGNDEKKKLCYVSWTDLS